MHSKNAYFHLQVSVFRLDNIIMRYNPSVTRPKVENFVYERYSFHKQVAIMDKNDVLIDYDGNVLCRLLKDIIPDSLLRSLETTAAACKAAINLDEYLVVDCRGEHVCVRIGSLIERGGSGRIRTAKLCPEVQKFLDANEALWKFVSFISLIFCPEDTVKVLGLPPQYNELGAYSIGFWNISDISKIHRDSRDKRWCLLIPFGDFLQGNLDLTFLNTLVSVKRGDMCFFWSSKIWHNLRDVLGDRQALLLTNHDSVLRRFK